MSIGAVAVARCEQWKTPPYSENPQGLTRRYLTPAHRAAIDCLSGWMREAGMAVRLDAAGTLIGRYEGTTSGPTLLIGSHIDSVRDAGAFDGALGVMLGLGCIGHLAATGKRHPFAIELLAFGDEEGSRFHASMVGSRSLAGNAPADAANYRDEAGTTLAQAMQDFGLDPARLPEAACNRSDILLYLEPHIEQGPVLEAADLPVGVVTGIAAQTRLAVKITGKAGHAGTTPMGLRADALAAAAEAVLALERIAAASPEVVGTVGVIEALPGAANVVPGQVNFSVDVRARSVATRDAALGKFENELAAIAAKRGTKAVVEVVQRLAPCFCDHDAQAKLAQAIEAQGIQPRYLTSGAGHDAMSVAVLAPVAMLFIRCRDGLSHHPDEAVRVEDVDAAARVILEFWERLAKVK